MVIPIAASFSYISLFPMTCFQQDVKPEFEIKLFFWEIRAPRG